MQLERKTLDGRQVDDGEIEGAGPDPFGLDVILGGARQVEEPAGEFRRRRVAKHGNSHPLGRGIGLEHQLGGERGKSPEHGLEFHRPAPGHLGVTGGDRHREDRRGGRLGPGNEERSCGVLEHRGTDDQQQRCRCADAGQERRRAAQPGAFQPRARFDAAYLGERLIHYPGRQRR